MEACHAKEFELSQLGAWALQAARETSGEAAQLSAALRAKEREVAMTAEQRDLAQKRLRNLERLILRAEDRSIDVGHFELPCGGTLCGTCHAG